MIKTLQLYDDQKELIVKLREAMKTNRSVLLQSPTGSGKTAMALYMIMKAAEKQSELDRLKDRKIIFTVPRKDLLEQTSETLRSYGVHHGYIASGKVYDPFASVYIAMVGTMSRKISGDPKTGKFLVKDLPKGYMVLVDETHFGSAELGKIIDFYRMDGAWVIGLSATPWKLNGDGMDQWYDVMIQGKPIQWLIDNKRLSDYDYYYGKTKPDLTNIRISNTGDYNQGELGGYMEAQGVIIGDCVSDYKARCMGKLHIVRCASVKHSQLVAEAFRAAGISAMHVDGETPMDERKRIFVAYAKREILVLTFCDLLNFGFDLSQASGMDVCIESGSDMKPSKSLAAQMQFWGRMLRYKPYPAIINDHVNNYIEHGLPCSERDWQLEGRKKKKGSGEATPPTRQCDECYYVHKPAPICPNCGYEYPIASREIDIVDGELVKVDKEEAKRQAQERAKGNRVEQAKAESLEDLIKLAQSRGYKNPVGWATHLFNARLRKKGH